MFREIDWFMERIGETVEMVTPSGSVAFFDLYNTAAAKDAFDRQFSGARFDDASIGGTHISLE